MKNGLKKLGTFATVASALAFAGCDDTEIQPKIENIDATCYYIAPSNGGSGGVQVRDNKDGHLLYVARFIDKEANGQVSNTNQGGHFFTFSVHKWSNDIAIPNEKMIDSALDGYTIGNKECSLFVSARNLTIDFSSGVSTEPFKANPNQKDNDSEHWYMYDVADGKPLPKATFAPAGENAIDVPKSQRAPAVAPK